MRKSGFNFLLLICFCSIFTVAQAHGAHLSTPDSLKLKKKTNRHDVWFAPDKGLHFLGSMMLTIASAKTLEQHFNFKRKKSLKFAVGFTVSLGIAKELNDARQKNNFFSWKDLTADCFGMILGRLILELK